MDRELIITHGRGGDGGGGGLSGGAAITAGANNMIEF